MTSRDTKGQVHPIYSHRNILTLVTDDIGQTLCSLNIILLHITSILRQIEKHFLLLTA